MDFSSNLKFKIIEIKWRTYSRISQRMKHDTFLQFGFCINWKWKIHFFNVKNSIKKCFQAKQLVRQKPFELLYRDCFIVKKRQLICFVRTLFAYTLKNTKTASRILANVVNILLINNLEESFSFYCFKFDVNYFRKLKEQFLIF